jgi:hypothetical protein
MAEQYDLLHGQDILFWWRCYVHERYEFFSDGAKAPLSTFTDVPYICADRTSSQHCLISNTVDRP